MSGLWGLVGGLGVGLVVLMLLGWGGAGLVCSGCAGDFSGGCAGWAE